MTREEAKEILEEVKVLDDSIYQYNEMYLQALDMAIKALEQESALDKIRAEIEAEYTRFRNWSDRWCERANGLGTALEIIDKYKVGEEE